jgi:hypothetical protein
MLIGAMNVRGCGELLRHLTLDPSRDYQPGGLDAGVYDVPTQPSTMSRNTRW